MVYLIVLMRIVTIMILLLLTALFIMGKRPIGELPVFDVLAVIVIGSIAGADIADPKIKHLPTAFAILALSVFQKFISSCIIKSKSIRKFLSFEPTIILKEGKLIYKNIKKINYAVDDILMLLREKGIFDLSKLSLAIIEANGAISIFKNQAYENVTLKDMHLFPSTNNFPISVILDGEILNNNLKVLNISEEQILSKVMQHGLTVKEIFYASIDDLGNLNISPYKNKDNGINLN